jgi:hypothetical protein
MTRLLKLGFLLAALAALPIVDAAAQVRGVVGVGLAVPVGDFADETGGAAQAGGGTALAGVEWLPAGNAFGLRLDGAYNRFCTSLCDEDAGDRDVRYRFLNANLNGILEFPVGADVSIHPYFVAGVGLYNYKLVGDDVPAGGESETDFGLNGGVGLTYQLDRFGIFGEARVHNVFTEGSDVQYIPVMVGARFNFR